MIGMERKIIVFICLIISLVKISGQSSHLLLVTNGDGAEVTKTDKKKEILKKASFLPHDEEISVLPKSGIETMMAGATFRFGENTTFKLTKEGIVMTLGSMMIQSRKIQNTVSIKSIASSVALSGAGTCLLEVEESGGFKIIGVLGRFKMKTSSSNTALDLMPGSLSSLSPDSTGFAKSTNINLSKLIDTSFLISGFPNSSTFKKSLASIAKQQSNAIGGSEDLVEGAKSEAGNPKSPPLEVNASQNVLITVVNNDEDNGYVIPEQDPLSELLGRAPRKFGENVAVPISDDVSKELETLSRQNKPTINPDNQRGQGIRPFPSRLLRKSKVQK